MAADPESFQHLTNQYLRELLVHCYRILGSVEDAEDALQETLLRAWRRLDSLQAQSALRAWLYRIATNVCLDMLDARKVRLLPSLTHPAADPQADLPAPMDETYWLDPLPESYLDEYQSNPEAHYEAQENVSLAFLVALQHLPARQRAILLLCDVLDWSAQEAADMLNMTIAAANSALQRARATLRANRSTLGETNLQSATNSETRLLLTQYLQAWESADVSGLLALLREDATYTMPPFPLWLHGRAAIRTFVERVIFAGKSVGDFRVVPTYANGAPAFVAYQREADGNYSLSGLHILTIVDGQIAEINTFLNFNRGLFTRFHLPPLTDR